MSTLTAVHQLFPTFTLRRPHPILVPEIAGEPVREMSTCTTRRCAFTRKILQPVRCQPPLRAQDARGRRPMTRHAAPATRCPRRHVEPGLLRQHRRPDPPQSTGTPLPRLDTVPSLTSMLSQPGRGRTHRPPIFETSRVMSDRRTGRVPPVILLEQRTRR